MGKIGHVGELEQMLLLAVLRLGKDQDYGATPGRGGRPRRHLSVPPAGLEALQASRRALTNLWDGLDAVMDQG